MRGREPPVAALQHRLQHGEAAVDGHEGGAQPVLEQGEGPVVGTVAQITVLIGEDHLMSDAIRMQSDCNQHAIIAQITVLIGEDHLMRDAISMQSDCNQHAIRMQSAQITVLIGGGLHAG